MASKTENRKIYLSINGKEVEHSYSGIRKEVKRVSRELDKLTPGTEEFERKSKELRKVEKRFDQVSKATGRTNRGMQKSSNLLQGMGGLIAGAFSVGAIMQVGRQMVNVRREFERYIAVLKTSLGSAEEANAEFERIKNFASETPFSVRQLTDSFVKLTNQGFRPNTEEMRKLGDLASSTGKTFGDLSEAIIDAQTGEFERLKEFGVLASKEGDKVTFAFKGVEKQVDFTSDSIRDYILSLGEMEGVTGSMTEISKTLDGAISNLGDSYDSFLMAVSESDGKLAMAVNKMGDFLNVMTKSIELGRIMSKWEMDDFAGKAQTNFNANMSRIRQDIEENGATWDAWKKKVSAGLDDVTEKLNQEGLSEDVRAKLQAQKAGYELTLAEIGNIQGKVTARERAEEKEREKNRQQTLQKRKEIQKKIEDVLDKGSQSETEKIREKYQTLIEKAEQYGIDTTELAKAMNNELMQLEKEQTAKEQEEQRKRAEKLRKEAERHREQRKKIREKYGLLTKEEEVEEELATLKGFYEEELITYEEYQQAKAFIEDRYREQQVEKEKQAQDEMKRAQMERLRNTQQVISHFSNMVQSLQDAELSRVEEVTRRQGESEEEFTRRKEEAEEERHQIQKKYATLQALADVAQIGVSTATAIMQAYAQLGPIAGTVAAVALGITGAAQASMAIQEANKIQGYAEGVGVTKGMGFRDDTGQEVAGVVHEGEQVIPKWMKQSPKYAPTLDALEYARANQLGRFAQGTGSAGASVVNNNTNQTINVDALAMVADRLNGTLQRIERNGIYAVADDEFQRDMQEKKRTDQFITDNSRI